MSDVDRVPPHSLESEMAVLGAAMTDREALEVVVDIVAPADFYAHTHATIFATIAELHAERAPIDKLAVVEKLRGRKQLDQIGGLPYLSTLVSGTTTAASADYFATIVREKAQLRALIRAGSQISACGFDGEADVENAIARAESCFSAAVDRGVRKLGGEMLYDTLRENVAELRAVAAGAAPSGAIVTPWRALNALIGPMMPGEMTIWPAAAASGKSAMLFQLVDFLAAHYGATALFSFEMSKRAVAMRYGAMYGGVSARRQRSGDLAEWEIEKIEAAAELQRSRPLWIYDLDGMPRLADIRRELRLLAQQAPIKAIAIDGVNFLADVDAQKGERSTKNDRLDAVYRALIRYAKEFGAIVHAVQHVNREGMGGPPSLRDIRDGGNAEGHAHAVVVPFRPRPNGSDDERRQGQFIVLKTREGGAGTVEGMEFVGHRSMWLQNGERPWFEATDQEDLEEPIDEYSVPA